MAVATILEVEMAAQAEVLVTVILTEMQTVTVQVTEVEITNHIIVVAVVVLTKEVQINIVTTLLVTVVEVKIAISQVSLNGTLVAAVPQATITLQKLLEDLVAEVMAVAVTVKMVPVAAVVELKVHQDKFITAAQAVTVL